MRISTQAASQSALSDLMRAQREAYDAREQLASGKKSMTLDMLKNNVVVVESC